MFGSDSKSPTSLAHDDIARARGLLPSLRLKLDKANSAAAHAYGTGLALVADAVARTFNVSVESALAAGPLGARQVAGARDDLARAHETCRLHLASDRADARELAQQLTFGCLVLSHLYTMRLHALSGPQELRAEAATLADKYTELCSALWRTAATDAPVDPDS